MEGVQLCTATHYPVEVSPGDHHTFVLELNLCHTIGKPRFKVIIPLAHRLCCTLPGTAHHYCTLLVSFCQLHQLDAHLHNLFQMAQQPQLNHNKFRDAMEIFDKIKMEGMCYAEKRC